MVKSYFTFNKIQENPFRIMNLMVLIFLVLWIGYINHNFLISSFSSLGIFYLLLLPEHSDEAITKAPIFDWLRSITGFYIRAIVDVCHLKLEPFAVGAVAFSRFYFALVPYF